MSLSNIRLPVIVQETTNGAVTNSYVYGLDMLSATDNSNVTTYFLQDGLGSTTGLTDDDGAMTATYQYDVFGALKSQTGEADTSWRFTGELNDSSVGRSPYYLRARYYDPALGRFLTKDPFPGFAAGPQSQNRYTYSGNDPVNLVDPYGLCGLRSIGDVADCGKKAVDKAEDVTGGVADAAGAVADDLSDPDVWKPLAGVAIVIVADVPEMALAYVCIQSAGAACAPLEIYSTTVALPANALGFCLMTGEDFGIPGAKRVCSHASGRSRRGAPRVPYSSWDAYHSKEGGFSGVA